ncbi:MAG TPA: hypothetical protein VGH79_09800 [Gaiellaceae bacterium]|jgi:hypothetical protein
MRLTGRVVLTIAGVLAVLGCLGSVASAVAVWTSTHCYPEGEARGNGSICVRTGNAAGLTHSPWTYLALGLGLLALAVCLFTAGERIRGQDVTA